MEVCVPCNTSAGLNISSSGGSSTDPSNLIDDSGLSMSDLKTCLNEFLNIEEIGISNTEANGSLGKNDVAQDSDKTTPVNSASEKCFGKCATFPPIRGSQSSGDAFAAEKGKHEDGLTIEVTEVNDPAKPFNQCYSRSLSLPIPLKPVSAMKGSREKQGLPPKQLSVTWAPDVYDPIPTSVSHVPSNKNQSYRSHGKKSGKYKQKGSGGKSSRGSKGKDKKQGRKNSGGSSKPKPFHEDSGVSFVEPHVGTVDFDVGNPDPFCGSSFLKQSVTKLHFPVAEAT